MSDKQEIISCDVAIVGAGPGGSSAATFAAQRGLHSVMIEKEAFPRYHIGESLTGTAGELLRALGLNDEMAQRCFPVKSGVKVMGKHSSEYFVPVLASTWQVRRDEFDHMLLDHALKQGSRLVRGQARKVIMEDGMPRGLVCVDKESNRQFEVRCKALIDASGTGCFLSHAGLAGEKVIDDFSDQIAVFSQVKGALRDPGEMGDNTFIFYSKKYHWAWFIPLSADVVSVGVVLPKAMLHEFDKDPEKLFNWGLEHIHPDLHERVRERPLCEPVRAIRDYSYRLAPFAGPGWFCIGDSHRFADPIFSFGVTASMTEAQAAIAAIADALPSGEWASALDRYVTYSNTGQDAIFDFIRYFWTFPGFFGIQMRGKLRKDVIRVFGGDLFVPNPVVDYIRELMANASADPAQGESSGSWPEGGAWSPNASLTSGAIS